MGVGRISSWGAIMDFPEVGYLKVFFQQRNSGDISF